MSWSAGQIGLDQMEMQFVPQFDLTGYNTFGLTSSARLGTTINVSADAASALAEAKERSLPLRVLGGGSNVILNSHFDGLVALMRIEGCDLAGRTGTSRLVRVGAGVDWQHLVEWTLARDLPGLENLAGIPGTAGAAPVQNIGAYGIEFASRLHDLTAFDTLTGRFEKLGPDACRFGYRDSVFKRQPGRYMIVEVTLALPLNWRPTTGYRGLETLGKAAPQRIMERVLEIRSAKLPDWRQQGNAGSFFCNPAIPRERAAALADRFPELPVFPLPRGLAKLSAAWMIEQCGLKGARSGAAGVSCDHALVIVNHGGATQGEIASLAERVRGAVLELFDVSLAQEPEWL